MRRLLSVLSALLLFLSPATPVLADGPTLSGSITVEIASGGEWLRVPLHMRYAHENGRLADGLLAFMPLAEYAAFRGSDVPKVILAEDFACRVSTTDYPQDFSCMRLLYRQEADQLTPVETESLTDLPPGLYLLAWNVTARRGSESYAGTALAWLVAE
ncbi:MAG: hypothetical protein IJ343_02515 [Clostridia bacterium]|nr:hypothetical protein [Clostridia bacterium]